MQSIKILSLVLLLSWTQNGDAAKTNTEVSPDVATNNDLLELTNDVPNNDLTKLATQRDRELRNVKEIRNIIRNSVVKAWNFVKVLAENTKQKLNTGVQNVKKRAHDETIQFKDHIKRLKQKILDIIHKTFQNKEAIKMCLHNEVPGMDKTINTLIQKFSTCIRDNMKKSSTLRISTLTVNDTDTFRNLDRRFEMCEHDLDNAEECLNKVRQDNFDDMENKETDILKTRAGARNILDRILRDLVACSIEGLLEATTVLTLEAVKITKCIVKPK